MGWPSSTSARPSVMPVSLQKASPTSAAKGRRSPPFSRSSNALFRHGTDATSGNMLAVATEDGLVHFWSLSNTNSSSAIVQRLKAAPDPISSFRPYTANSRCSTRVAWIPVLSEVSRVPRRHAVFPACLLPEASLSNDSPRNGLANLPRPHPQ